MVASEYNQRQVNKGAWSIADLPEAWPGRQAAIDQGVNSDQFRRAVQCFQAGAGLDPDGKLGPNTLAALARVFPAAYGSADQDVLTDVGGTIFRKPTNAEARPPKALQGKYNALEQRIADLWNQYGAAIADQADQYKIPVHAALAVFATEAGNRAYDPKTGLIMIRFENHAFRRKTEAIGTNRCHDGRQSTEWAMLKDAAGINLESAFASTSFGLAQIMGFNHQAVGYDNPVDMAASFHDNVINQIKGFFDFCRSGDLDSFIRRRDWSGFTLRYNGPGQVAHYSGVLKKYLAAAGNMNFE